MYFLKSNILVAEIDSEYMDDINLCEHYNVINFFVKGESYDRKYIND